MTRKLLYADRSVSPCSTERVCSEKVRECYTSKPAGQQPRVLPRGQAAVRRPSLGRNRR